MGLDPGEHAVVGPSSGFDLGSAMARGAGGSCGGVGLVGLGFLSPIFVPLFALLCYSIKIHV